VSDRITVVIGADGAVADAVRAHEAFIAGETLAVAASVVPGAEVAAGPQPVGEAGEVRVHVTKR
jgi:isoleucyl-tRNA synthetase